MKFAGEAPRKAILFGEHYVVHGAKAICVPILPGTRVEISRASGKPGVRLVSSLGDDFFSREEAGTVEAFANLHVAYCEFLEWAKAREKPLVAHFFAKVPQKGTGMSASFATSFLRALCAAYGRKIPKKTLLGIVQEAEEVAHGRRASGIDAAVIIEGKPILFERKFEPTKFVFRKAKISLPRGACILLCDTFEGTRAGTRDMVEKFAKSHGVEGAATAAQRKQIVAEFEQVFRKAAANLKGRGVARALGECMNAAHELLSQRGVSSLGIERCREVALEQGALGAKLTGAGGEGGAVLVLCERKAKERMIAKMKSAGFFASEVRIAEK